MTSFAPAFPAASSDVRTAEASRAPSAPTSWFARLKSYFVIEFDALDTLDLGTPDEFDAYVCDLFERGPSLPA